MDNDTTNQQGQQDQQGSQGGETPVNPPVDTSHIRPTLPPRDPQILEEGKKIGDLQKRDE